MPDSRIVRMTDDGAGTITVVAACYSGHLHTLVTGRATTERAATRLRGPVQQPVAAQPTALAC